MIKKAFCLLLAMALLLPAPSVGAVSAASFVLIDADSGELLHSHNANVRRSMASTTKIMTAIILCEAGELDRIVTITRKMIMVEGSSVGLQEGDRISRRCLLYGLMLESGNDAACAIAIELAGSNEAFAKLMNKTAKKIGMKNSSFVTPNGLDDKNHYSTAYDMALLAQYAMQNAQFREVVGSKSYRAEYNGGESIRTYSNHNRLLRSLPGCEGVKTGFTKKSGRCLVSACKRNGKRLIAVTLGAPDDWNDHISLYEQGFSMYETVTLHSVDVPDKLAIISSTKNSITLAHAATKAFVQKDVTITAITELPRFIYAPIAAGERVGCVKYYAKGRQLCAVDICTAESADIIKPKEKTIYDALFMLLCIK